jgi:chromosome segregation ATPase
VVTRCELVDGQQWTDGGHHYSDDGSFWGGGRESSNDLVAFVGLLPDNPQPDQSAEIERLRTELLELKASVPKAAVEIDRLNTVLGEQASVIDSLKESNERLQAEVLQAQQYVSEANEKINQQTRTIEHLSDKVRSLERFNDDKENDLDHLRQLRRTNEAVIKELRTLLTYALSKK